MTPAAAGTRRLLHDTIVMGPAKLHPGSTCGGKLRAYFLSWVLSPREPSPAAALSSRLSSTTVKKTRFNDFTTGTVLSVPKAGGTTSVVAAPGSIGNQMAMDDTHVYFQYALAVDDDNLTGIRRWNR